jgi:predicted dehydrogenase
MQEIRIGIIGAGANCRLKHIPELQKIAGVSITAVCNRSEQSSLKIAREFGIKQIYSNWQELIEDEDIDAIVIGTWPNMHEIITNGALLAGKHVLCEARMAMNASQAHEMLRTANCFPHLIAQLVPAPFTLPFDRDIQQLIGQNSLGKILAVNVTFNGTDFLNTSPEMSWRENCELSGLNTMMMGIVYESISRWLGHAKSVMAMGKIFNQFKTFEGQLKAIEIPEHLNIIAEMNCGALAQMQFSSATGLSQNNQEIWIYGSEGTIKLNLLENTLSFGKKGDKELTLITPEVHKSAKWRVEEEFIGAIRGNEKIKFTSFTEGVKYMEFTEAVAISCRQGKTIQLPLNLNNNG